MGDQVIKRDSCNHLADLKPYLKPTVKLVDLGISKETKEETSYASQKQTVKWEDSAIPLVETEDETNYTSQKQTVKREDSAIPLRETKDETNYASQKQTVKREDSAISLGETENETNYTSQKQTVKREDSAIPLIETKDETNYVSQKQTVKREDLANSLVETEDETNYTSQKQTVKREDSAIPLIETKDETNYASQKKHKNTTRNVLIGKLLAAVDTILLLVIALLVVFLVHENKYLHGKFQKENSVNQSTTTSPTLTLPTMAGHSTFFPPTLPRGPWDKLRLPRSVVPSHYELHLNVDPNKDGYDGEETITVDVTEETPYILIHSSGLNITEASVQKPTSEIISIKKYFDAIKNDFHVIETAESLSKGKYKLKYKFHGLYSTSLYGFYKGVYRRNDGKMANFLSTQLEPIDARTMFPCFDEPALKATIKISLAYPKDMVGLSNGEVEKEDEKDQTKYSSYKTTPKMSVYLVSVVVGHFISYDLITPSGVKLELRAFAQTGNENQLDFALMTGMETLVQMEEMFGIKYNMSKLDLIALPEASFAMGSWGSIRLSEDSVLYKKDFSSEEVVNDLMLRLVTHEVIHMWFGNYVTMKWWNDTWLKEAVAEYYTYFDGFSKTLQSSWKKDVQFVDACHANALEIDGYVNTRPVIQTTTTPTSYTFDRIVYKKGSSLLNMVKHFYPKKENFNKGMKKYLSSFAYGSAVGNNMWDALQATCPLKECPNFTEVMDTWMKKKHYPVLTLKKTGSGKYTVTQERFVYDQSANLEKTLWRLQFTYFCSDKNTTQTTPQTTYNKWLNNEASVKIICGGDGWIKLNLGQIGFHRVNYAKETWRQLAEQLRYWPKVFSAVDRYGLIDDAFNLVRGGRLDIKTALNMTTYLRGTNEMDYMPWLAVQRNTGYILGVLPPHSHNSMLLKKYLAYQSSKVMEKLGYLDIGTPFEKLLRMVVVSFQCDAGSRSCLGNLTTMFRQWKKDPLTPSLTPALRKFIYYYGIRQGTQQDWDLMLQRVQNNTVATEYRPLLYGLAGSRVKSHLHSYLRLTGNVDYVKKQYYRNVMDNVANHNPDGPFITWTFLQMNWKQLKQKDPVEAMMKYLPTIAKRFSTTQQFNQLKKFINDNLDGQSMPRNLLKTLEVVKLNIAWRKAHESDLGEWLKAFLESKKYLTRSYTL